MIVASPGAAQPALHGRPLALGQVVATFLSLWPLGRERYPDATTLTITADCGGSNGNRTRLFKTELQRLADDTGLAISVCHFPPGTSKWNKIEHRLFSFIAQNWRGRPLVSHQVIVGPAHVMLPTSAHRNSPPASRS